MDHSVVRKEEQQDGVALHILDQEGTGPEEQELPYPALAPVVLLCLKQTTTPRSLCLQMIHSPWLDYSSILTALLTCVTLCMYQPNGEHNIYLGIVKALFFAYFIVEMVIKMVALGVVGYLSNSWNKFDFFINSGEVLDYILARYGFHWQVFQALRPIRLFSRIPSMQVLVAGLVDTLPMLANVLFLNMLAIHIFSVVGVQLWAGQLRNRCFLGEDIPTKYNVSLSSYFIPKYGQKFEFICAPDNKDGMQRCSHIPPYRVDGETCSMDATQHASAAVNGTSGCIDWNQYYNVCRAGDTNPYMGAINFDNIFFSWITIFQVVTLEGWSEIMFYVMDSHSFWTFLFFVFVTMIGSFVMMNVCAVVIATQFSENMERKTVVQLAGTVTIADIFNKLKCLVTGMLLRMKREIQNRVHPRGRDDRVDTLGQAWIPYKRILKRTVESTLFDRLIMLVVVFSVGALVFEHHEQPEKLTQVLRICNIIFTIIFLMEMVAKLLALKWEYFKDWNDNFDFVLVIISLWEVIGKAEGKPSVLRSLRLLRFVRLLHFLPYLERQLRVLKKTFEEASALFLLLLSLNFVFSVLGMLLFGGKFQFKTKHGDIVPDRKNFDNLLWSMVTVFQILTQEDWNLVLYNAMSTTSPWAILYFVVLIMVGKYVLLNVLVGIVVQSFQDISSPSSASSETDPSRPSVTDPAPDLALPDTSEDERTLNFIQKVLHWCKDHDEWSLYVFSPRNRCRMICRRMVSHSMFDHVILLFILLSCVTIAMERPGIDPRSTERLILNVSLYVFSAVFLVEMLLKVLALGLLFGKDSYCRSLWNTMDGLLVILSLVHIFVSLGNAGKTNMLSILKVLRLLRTFRSLRVIKRAPKLKLAVESLIAAVKPIGNIVLICCMYFFFFGILGVQLFKGKFHHCLGHDIRNITTKSECLAANYRWTRKKFNFDSLPQALMSLFAMFSTDDWVNIMYDGLDAVGVGKQPVKNYNEWMLLYFISFMVMSFFLLDMFIGVMVETFHQCQQEQRAADEVSLEEGGGEVQAQHREPEQVPYFTNYSKLRRWIHTLCTSSFLDLFVTTTIFLSVLVMAVEHYNQPQYVEKLTEYSYYVFTVIFVIEVLLKLVAFGVLRFMRDSWNLLDIIVVVISILSIIFNKMNMADKMPINPSILRVCRVLRLAQVLKAKKIRVLLNTVIKTLLQVENICLLFMFFFFIYAALGVELFGRLECTEDNPCLGLHRYANFKHFGAALLTLYQVCTGDNWSGILKDTLRECPPGRDGCSSYMNLVSPVYFITFVIMAQFVLANLVVAAIMQALEDSKQEDHVRPPRNQGQMIVDPAVPAPEP
ncbi:voltage-dependent T-type calcium channel subunit alpha-1H-like isoform X1 [Notolabrus celidotus]|uniref:voltage-dependent T-type calcium channel subunit alpha-1H-like isoform X1 n=1 Tax=Notolabrus celidotus TaxID=1203425 RepID=UPI00148F9A5A|nr:voltage-dependent T-type calcium channel subunit alpha-1H-like isoform X1 [Notolabrus celidotus]